MPKPYVICHMLQSIDGRIDGSFFGVPTTAELSAYYQKKSQSLNWFQSQGQNDDRE